MWPLTCGAIPTKFARTVASSVCGRISHCSIATMTMTAAPATISTPSTRPAVRRATESPGSTRGDKALHPEEGHPEDEGDENRKARVNERPGADVRIHAQPDEEFPSEDRDDDADRRTEHPGRKERADDVDLRSHDLLY